VEVAWISSASRSASAYADQTERDHAARGAAARQGRIQVATEF
jgi:hypothetical protein